MVSGAVLAVIMVLSTGEAPSMTWRPFQPTAAARPSPPETTAVVASNPWIDYANATSEQRIVHKALLEHVLDSQLELFDRVSELPPLYAAALKAEVGPTPIADGDGKMIGGCVGQAGIPFQRLMLCAFDGEGGLLLVQYGGFKPGAWLKLFSTSGGTLRERAVYAFTPAFAGGTAGELLGELTAVVGDTNEVYSVLRRYLSAHPEPSFLNLER